MSVIHILRNSFILGACFVYHYGVAQNNTVEPGAWSIRLVDGIYESEGRVEVFLDDQWGTICDSLWSIEDATVVCRQLNYIGADLALVAGQYDGGQGVILFNNMECGGTEKNLSSCKYEDQVDPIKCDHSRDVGVVCTSHGSLRLAGGSVLGEGRVEILGVSGDWGTVCDNGWDETDAGVACRQLGYPDALEARVNEDYPDTEPVFGPGSGPILLDGLQCTNVKRHLRDCQVTKAWGIHDCTHGEDAGMTCDTKLIRLVDGDFDDEGRVEVYYGGAWGRICSTTWSIEDAHVACRELGYPLGARNTKIVEGGDGPFLLDDMKCEGVESHLADCKSPGWANNLNCDASSTHSAGVVCNDPLAVVRLLSGSTSYEGVVQYRFSSETGLICDPDWSESEANVTCHQLGYQYGRNEKPVLLGPLSGTIFYHDYRCDGTEQQIGDCMYSVGSSDVQCSPDHIAQVSCGPPIEFDLRMTGSKFSEQGLLEVFLKGEWGYVAAGILTMADHDTICRHLGYAGGGYAYNLGDVFVVSSSRPVLIDDLSCRDNDMKINDCYTLELSGPTSTRRSDEGTKVLCLPYENVANHPVRLRDENGVINTNYGAIEIYHDGVWGSVCDSYFFRYEILCSELGHKNTTNGGPLSNYDNRYTARGRFWFKLSYCPTHSYTTYTYAVEHDRLYECFHYAWGDVHGCSREDVATVRCVPVDQTDADDYYYNTVTEADWQGNLGGWAVFLIALAVVIPTCLIIGCCYRSQRIETIRESGAAPPATYTAATNTTHIDGVSSESNTPAPPYAPPSPTPDECPPTNDSVTTPLNSHADDGTANAENV